MQFGIRMSAIEISRQVTHLYVYNKTYIKKSTLKQLLSQGRKDSECFPVSNGVCPDSSVSNGVCPAFLSKQWCLSSLPQQKSKRNCLDGLKKHFLMELGTSQPLMIFVSLLLMTVSLGHVQVKNMAYREYGSLYICLPLTVFNRFTLCIISLSHCRRSMYVG